MKYLLDTDHLSILQRESAQDYINFSTRMAYCLLSDFAISIVTFHEQILGTHTYVNRARNSSELAKGYEMMARLLRDFTSLPLAPFDRQAAAMFDSLQSQRIQLAKMDLRIAAIALSRGYKLLTRNHRDFSKVPELLLEDWTTN